MKDYIDNFVNNEFKPFQEPDFHVKGLLEGLVNVIVTDEKKALVDMRELHKVLEIETQFNKWIERKIEAGGFNEQYDFWSFLSKSTGGRPRQEYYFLLNSAKEAAMMENNQMGKYFRQYFIDMEQAAIRLFGKFTRRGLTDVINEYWKPMYGNGIFGKVTDELVYKQLFNKRRKQLCFERNIRGNLRDYFSKEELEKVEIIEKEIASFIIDFQLSFEEIERLLNKKYRIRLLIQNNFTSTSYLH